MIDLDAEIEAIRAEIRETPYHKGTEHHLGRLKAKLARLKKTQQRARKKAGGVGFVPKKAGDATVVLLGPPSVGKSTILNQLTGAHSRVEPWPFSTVRVVQGMLFYQGAQIQIFDLPGMIDQAAKGVGHGREILAAAKVADLLLLVVDGKTLNKLSSLLAILKKLKINKPFLIVINKVDLWPEIPPEKVAGQIFISAVTGLGLEELKLKIWQKLGFLRIFLKPRWRKPDLVHPLILKKGQTVAEAASRIFPDKTSFKQIFLWGPSALFPGQGISLTHELKDKDILSFIS